MNEDPPSSHSDADGPGPETPPQYVMPIGKLVTHQAPPLGEEEGTLAILAEMEKQLKPKKTWGGAAFMLFFTLVLFVVAGGFRWSWEYALLLVPILFLHEAGHYVTMRIFRYRNLRMFFLPLFGAAVSGEHFDVKGWKKALVALMGPLPGILAGCIFAVVYFQVEPDPWLSKIGLLLLVLNGFNLLPFLPLDGGWFWHAVLFCRNRWVEAFFKTGAAAAFIWMAVWLDIWLLYIPGVLMLVTIQMSFHVATVTQRLRAGGVEAGTTPDGKWATDAVERIIAEVRASGGKSQQPTDLATIVLQVFERLNARPPGILPSLGLVSLYFLGLGTALVAWVALFMFPGRFSEESEPLAYHGIFEFKGAAVADGLGIDIVDTIAASFPSAEAAGEFYAGWTGDLAERVTLLGPAVFVVGVDLSPARRREIRRLMQEGGAEVYDPAQDIFPYLRTTVRCLGPSVGATGALSTELAEYLNMPPSMRLWPPWADRGEIDAAVLQAEQSARQIYRRIEEVVAHTHRDPRLGTFIEELYGRGYTSDPDRREMLEQQYRAKLQELRTEALRGLRDEPDMNADLIDLYLKQPVAPSSTEEYSTYIEDYHGWLAEWGRHMGQVPLREGQPVGLAAQSIATSGTALPEEESLIIIGLTFHRMDVGLPALLQYLEKNGFRDVTFTLPTGTGSRSFFGD